MLCTIESRNYTVIVINIMMIELEKMSAVNNLVVPDSHSD